MNYKLNLFNQCINRWQIPSETIIIKSISDYKIIWYFKSDIIERNVLGISSRFIIALQQFSLQLLFL